MAHCPLDIFLEYLSDREVLLQKLASGESIRDVALDFQQKAGYKSKEGAKQAALRRLASEARVVLERIFREEGELYSVPLLELLKKRAEKSRSRYRAKAWWCRRRKDSVFVTVGNRRGAVRQEDAWRLQHPGCQVLVDFPDGNGKYFPVAES